MEELKHQILITLSFYEALTLEQIIMQFDEEKFIEHSDITLEDLKFQLKLLCKEGTLKEVKKKKDRAWIRIFKKRSVWHTLKGYIKFSIFLFIISFNVHGRVIHEVVSGDTLMNLSYKYYGTHRCWKQIYKNMEKIKTEKIETGILLTIPHYSNCSSRNIKSKIVNRWWPVLKTRAQKKTKYSIQLGAFKKLKDAKHLQLILVLEGIKTRLESAYLKDKGKWYRVRLGQFLSYKSAQNYLLINNLKLFSKGAFVVGLK